MNLPVIRGLAVSTNVDPPSSPCGMCRQFIREFCDKDMKIWMYGGRWDRGERDGEAVGQEGEGADAEGKKTQGKGEGKIEGKVVEIKTIGELLPMSFGREDMERGAKPW